MSELSVGKMMLFQNTRCFVLIDKAVVATLDDIIGILRPIPAFLFSPVFPRDLEAFAVDQQVG